MTPGRPPFRPWELAFLALLVGGYLGLSALWLAQDRAPPLGHGARWAGESVSFWQDLHESLRISPGPYPPLMDLSSAAVYEVLGPRPAGFMVSSLAWAGLFLAGSWLLGREVGGPAGGVLTGLAAASDPWMATYARTYVPDVAAAALVALSLAALLASDSFRRPGPTMVTGACLGLGMLAKWSYVFFMVLPVALAGIPALRGGRHSRSLVLLGLGLLSATGLTLRAAAESPWMLDRYGLVLAAMGAAWLLLTGFALGTRHRNSEAEGWNPGAGFCAALGLGVLLCLWWYLLSARELEGKALWEATYSYPADQALRQVLWIVSNSFWLAPAWLLAGTAAGLAARDSRLPTLVLLGGLLGPMAVFTFADMVVTPRYLLPLAAPAAALGFAWLGRRRRLVGPAALLAAVMALLGPGALLLGDGSGAVRALVPAETPPSSLLPEDWARVPGAPPPFREPFPLDETVKVIRQEGGGAATAVLAPGVSFALFCTDALNMVAAFQGVPLELEDWDWGEAGRPEGDLVLLVLPPGGSPSLPAWVAGAPVLGNWEAPGRARWSLYRLEAPRAVPGSRHEEPRRRGTQPSPLRGGPEAEGEEAPPGEDPSGGPGTTPRHPRSGAEDPG